MNAQMGSQAISIDAPVEGWNAYDSLDSMPPTAAVILNNLIPGAGKVDTRKGHIEYADLETGLPVETVASLNTSVGSQLIAASAGGLFDLGVATVFEAKVFAAPAALPSAPIGTFSNDRW